MDQGLLRSEITVRADIEFTTGCNLRCVYCVSLIDGWVPNNLDPNLLDKIVDCLKMRKAIMIGASGHGETTSLIGWHHYCNRIKNEGMELYLSTNLARVLTEDEFETLSRFRVIQVSCDTCDTHLFKRLRPGGDFRTLVYNMAQIRGHAIRRGDRCPTFWWNCVVSDMTVWKLKEHVAYGLALGVKVFNFISLVRHAALGNCAVNLVSDMPREQLEHLPNHFRDIFELIRKNRASYICDGLLERVTEKLSDTAANGMDQKERRHFSLQPTDMTRDCLDPWIYFKVSSGGGIMPCCRSADPVGYIEPERSISETLNNAGMQTLRRSLLTGCLPELCRACNIRGWTKTTILNRKVVTLSQFGWLLPILHRWGLLLPIVQKWRGIQL